MEWSGLDRFGSGYGPVEGSCEHGNEPSGSIKCWEVLEMPRNWRPQLHGVSMTGKIFTVLN
jgi:hypothetical protein